MRIITNIGLALIVIFSCQSVLTVGILSDYLVNDRPYFEPAMVENIRFIDQNKERPMIDRVLRGT